MALPGGFDNAEDYFRESLEFLGRFQWLFNYPNTHILVDKVLEKFPQEWKLFFRDLSIGDACKLSEAVLIEGAPESLNTFLQTINNLKPPLEAKCTKSAPLSNNKGLSLKKQHEISMLAPIIDDMCKKTQSNLIVDVGSGLGYLPELLSSEYDYRVIGVESDAAKIKSAELNRQKLHKKDLIQYAELYVDEQSEDKLREMVNKNNESVCITGLHACADLSATILKIFLKLEFAKSLVIMPCCYHRLSRSSCAEFANFPLSKTLSKLALEKSSSEFLQVPFLRLACQGRLNFTQLSPQQHDQQAQNCLFRAILQEVAERDGHQVRRLKRKSVKLSECNDPFEAYLTNLKTTHVLFNGTTNEEPSTSDFLEKMREKWTRHKQDIYLVKALTALQLAIQNLCENIVLYDRVVFLSETSPEVECFVQKVTDERLSPRCHALLATKRAPFSLQMAE